MESCNEIDLMSQIAVHCIVLWDKMKTTDSLQECVNCSVKRILCKQETHQKIHSKNLIFKTLWVYSADSINYIVLLIFPRK